MNSLNIKIFYALPPSHLLKVTKFLVKIPNLNSILLTTGKNIFVYKFFVSLNILVYFLCKNCNPPENDLPLFPSKPPSKNGDSAKPPFLKICFEVQPLPWRQGVYSMLKLELLEIFIYKTEDLISAVVSFSRIVYSTFNFRTNVIK